MMTLLNATSFPSSSSSSSAAICGIHHWNPNSNRKWNPKSSFPCKFSYQTQEDEKPQTNMEENTDKDNTQPSTLSSSSSSTSDIDKKLKMAVQKTAATFAPRASGPQKSKNPAVPGSTLYSVFEVQGYISMALGGALSYNLVFPSNEPDIWRLMGMWSIWMFTIPSLRARDCSKDEKEALNYLFLLIPLINVILPFFWKSFALVWSADTVVFFAMYAWKMGWLQSAEKS